jgi:hypothetical protein
MGALTPLRERDNTMRLAMLIRLLCLTLFYLSIAVPAFSLGHYRDVVQDTKGNAVGNVSVSVYTQGTDTLATLYSDNGVTTKTNPFVTDATGSYDFYVAQGIYDIVLSCETCYGGRSYTFDTARDQNVFIAESSTAGVSGLDNNFDVENEIFNATLALPLSVGNGTQGMDIGGDATLGGFIRPRPLGDSVWRIWTNFNGIIRDEEAGATVLTIDPDAASKLLMYQFGSNYRPLKSVWIGAGALYGDGTQCPERPTAVTINSGPKIPTFICTDNNSSRLTGMLRMPGDWDGGTITFTHSYIQTAADTGVLNGDVAAQCRGTGETVSSTWGSEVAIDDAAVTGTNTNDLTTSAAVTPAGTCAAGDMLYFYYELDATGTTTAVATLHHLGFHLTYSSTSLSQ